jgi:hypothetical protein
MIGRILDGSRTAFEKESSWTTVTLAPHTQQKRLIIAGNADYLQQSLTNQTTMQPRLQAVYPNPFGRSLTVRYTVPPEITGRAVIGLYALNGQEIWSSAVTGGKLMQGSGTVTWNGRTASGIPIATGMYLLRFEVYDAGRTLRYRSEQKVVYMPR